MKILFADDKNTWHILIDKILKPREFEVIHSRSLKETLNKVYSEDPDVVVVDVSLENGKAYDVIPDIVENGFPVILIGLKSEGLDEAKAREIGVNFVMPKPFTVDELIKTLNEAKLQKKPSKKEARVILPGGKTIEEIPVETVSVEEEKMELQPLEVEPIEEIKVEPIETKPVKKAKEAEEKPEGTLEAKVPKEEIETQVREILEERVDKIVSEIAWEIIPEIAEKVIREEIEKLIKSRLA